VIEAILVLIWKFFAFVSFILLDLRHWFARKKLDQFLACFRHVVKNWKVKLDVGKPRFDLSVWDPNKHLRNPSIWLSHS